MTPPRRHQILRPEVAARAEAYVGRSIPRVEDHRLLTGTGRYGADFACEGQLHAHVVRSDVSHGLLRGIDTTAAKRRPGVVAVITAQDLPEVDVPIRLFPTENAQRALQPPLARERVRYVGDPVAVIVATSAYVAEDAAEDLAVDIEPLEPALGALEAATDGAPLLIPEIATNVIDRVEVRHGDDLDGLFAAADVVVSKRLHVQRHGAVPMEPRCLLARFDPEADGVTVWGAAKVKHFNRKILSDLLGMPPERIRCIEGEVGGGFGARGEFYPEDYLIPWLAIELRRPVKWVEDRRENLIALNHSREQEWEVEYAASAGGELLGFRARAWWNQGAYARTHGSVLLPKLMLNHMPGPYRWKAYEASAGTVLSNKTPAGTYRGPGQYEPTFVRERMVDLVAREVGIDPAELRRRNLVTQADMPYHTGLPDVDTGNPVLYDEGNFPLVYEGLLERVGHERLRKDVDARRARGECVGLGVTAFIEMGNPGIFEQARIVAEADGTFTAHVGVASLGQGVETVLSQVAADLLGVPIERVAVRYQDTATVPEGMGAFSSRATVWGGYAISGAVCELLERARNAAADHFEAPPEIVRVEGGVARIEEGQRKLEVPLGELGLEAFYRYEPPGGSHIQVGANVGVVEVDRESGEVKLQSYAIAYEVGKAVNPVMLEGQVQGSAVQGFGGALFEEFSYGPDGQPLATSFLDYALPTAAEMPHIDVQIVELGHQADDDPLAGAKGGGEGGIIATAATIANAVADALGPAGGDVASLPIMPETVQRLALEPR
jgi:aerobic carbon-monoxide dehydrogenase large subunit